MKQPNVLKWKIAANLCTALLVFGSSAFAAATVTLDNENGADPFTPSWTMASDSLIAGLSPSFTLGNFANDAQGADGIGALTTVHSLAWPSGYGTTIGQNSGTELVYILPANPNGYDITNITSYSGWWNDGRDGQDYRVYYSTVDAPGFWIAMPGAHFRNDGPAGISQPSCNRVTIKDSVDGTAAMATNVYSIMFDFRDTLDGGAENAYTGFGALTVEGTASANSVVPVPIVITGAMESGGNPFTPSWTAETPDLLNGSSLSSSSGGFVNEGCAGTAKLTDGAVGISGNHSTMASCGTGGGTTLIYTLTGSIFGSDITNIVTYSGWDNDGRYGQCYQISYATATDPSTFLPLTSVYYLPGGVPGGNAPACRVAVNSPTGAAIAQHVAKIKFDFASPPEAGSSEPSGNFNNAWQGYSEIIVQGNDSAPLPVPPVLVKDILPSTAEDVVGDQVVLKVAFGDSPPAILQWLQIVSGPVTNNINTGVVNVTNAGVITSTLTLNNVQLSDAGSYQVLAVNATNATKVIYTAACPLVVDSVPLPVGNTLVEYAAQTAVASSYSPSWDASLLSSSLIYSQSPSAISGPITDFTTPGGNGENASGPAILSDGNIGTVDTPLTGNNTTLTCMGNGFNVGHWVTYTLTGSVNGYDITNITSYAGAQNHDRDQQAYTVFYATAADPGTFLPLADVNFNPASGSGLSLTRATITPVSGVLASNVAALKFDMSLVADENGYSLYSEIGVYGSPSAPSAPPTAPTIASPYIVGGNLIVTGTDGTPGAGYTLLVTTNLSAPIIWTTNSTGTLDGTGAFSNGIPVDASQNASFFRLRLP